MKLKEKGRKNKSTMKKLKKQVKGITLIALVVTIVVLLILAGVSLNLVLGDNGIIDKAEEAVDKYGEAAENEQKELNNLKEWIEGSLGEVDDDTPGDITDGGEQDGSESKPYKVRSIEDFLELTQISRSDGLYDKYVDIETDLDFKSSNSYNDPNNTDIFGDYNEDGVTKGIKEELTDESQRGLKNGFEFAGTLNGNGHTISNIYMAETLIYNASEPIDFLTGIFHENSGTIKNLNIQGIMNVTIDDQTTAARVGGIVAQNRNGGQIINCTSDMQIAVTGSNLEMLNSVTVKIGGIVADNEDETENTKIDGCAYKGALQCNLVLNSNVSTEYYHQVRIGGIVADNKSVVTNSINEGSIDATKNFYTTINSGDNAIDIGGIVGKNNDNGIIENCINTGTIIGTSETSEIFVGGIVSSTEDLDTCITKNVYNSGKVSANTSNDITIGGVLADGYGVIDGAYNIGEISAQSGSGSIKIGAVIGDYHSSNTSVTNCYYNKVEGLYGAEGSDRSNITSIDNLTQMQVIQELNAKVDANNSSSSRKWYTITETGGNISFNASN